MQFAIYKDNVRDCFDLFDLFPKEGASEWVTSRKTLIEIRQVRDLLTKNGLSTFIE